MPGFIGEELDAAFTPGVTSVIADMTATTFCDSCGARTAGAGRPGPAGPGVPEEVLYPATPANLANFGPTVNFPLIFGAALILFGVATLVHFFTVSVTKRRRETGLLKALGFVRLQVALAVS